MLKDNFLTFWFRFIFKYSYIIEIGAYEQLKEVIRRDYPTYSGTILERYFRAKFIESKKYSRIGGYWDRRGEYEIDLIAINELYSVADVVEIKRKSSNIDLDRLTEKSAHLRNAISELKGYKINTFGLSLGDM